jgi:signal transduction histidine kinase
MTYVSQARSLLDRVVAAGRRITGTPEWPPAAGVLLGSLAMIETVLRVDDTTTNPSVALLLGLLATAPSAFARTRVLAAAAVITAANLLTLAGYGWLTGAGLVAQLAVLFLAGVRHAQRVRDEATQRDESRRVMADTLLEHAARGERARIARELHDVVAHHISMIAVQAETARLTTPGMPDDGAKRLLAIGDTARAALTEMRRLLGVLREDAGTETTRQPQPGLHQLNELIDESRHSGGAGTRLIVRGQVGPLDPGVELTAYRIVQEALTNARRHAPGAAVDVELDYGDDALRLRVRDNGPGPPTGTSAARSAAGHGLLGMRERAAAVGGDLRAGPAPVSGFLVEALLPAPRPAAARAAG